MLPRWGVQVCRTSKPIAYAPALMAQRLLAGVDRRELGAIFVGGAFGGGIRTWLSDLAPMHAGHWPWTTFIVNLVGCFLLGYFTTRLQERLPITAYRRPLLGTGVCGGLTTFSTFQLELLRMVERGDVALALGYVVTSVIAGFGGMMLGTVLVRRARLTW